ncbi:MAG: hypothetical protein RLZZ502_1747 [Pseudomonadota bacterium]
MANEDQRPLTEVAVAVLIADDGRVLFAQRPEGKPYAGYWEFPGGKCETGESVEHACVREIEEELGVRITQQTHWTRQIHSYPHARVHLHFQLCLAWTGTLAEQGKEGQALSWQRLGPAPLQSITLTPLLPALLADHANILLALQATLQQLRP